MSSTRTGTEKMRQVKVTVLDNPQPTQTLGSDLDSANVKHFDLAGVARLVTETTASNHKNSLTSSPSPPSQPSESPFTDRFSFSTSSATSATSGEVSRASPELAAVNDDNKSLSELCSECLTLITTTSSENIDPLRLITLLDLITNKFKELTTKDYHDFRNDLLLLTYRLDASKDVDESNLNQWFKDRINHFDAYMEKYSSYLPTYNENEFENIEKILQNIIFMHSFEEKGFNAPTVTFELEEGLQKSSMLKKRVFARALGNLLGNSLKYIEKHDKEKNGETNEIKIGMKTNPANEQEVLVTIYDTGPGIDPETIQKIISGTEFVDDKHKAKGIERSGLGLVTTMKSIQTELKGQFEIDSNGFKIDLNGNKVLSNNPNKKTYTKITFAIPKRSLRITASPAKTSTKKVDNELLIILKQLAEISTILPSISFPLPPGAQSPRVNKSSFKTIRESLITEIDFFTGTHIVNKYMFDYYNNIKKTLNQTNDLSETKDQATTLREQLVELDLLKTQIIDFMTLPIDMRRFLKPLDTNKVDSVDINSFHKLLGIETNLPDPENETKSENTSNIHNRLMDQELLAKIIKYLIMLSGNSLDELEVQADPTHIHYRIPIKKVEKSPLEKKLGEKFIASLNGKIHYVLGEVELNLKDSRFQLHQPDRLEAYIFAPRQAPINPRIVTSALVLEDSLPNRKLVIKLLNGLGFDDVTGVGDSNQAIEQAKNKAFDIVMTDLHLAPGDSRTGHTTAEEIQDIQDIQAMVQDMVQAIEMEEYEEKMKKRENDSTLPPPSRPSPPTRPETIFIGATGDDGKEEFPAWTGGILRKPFNQDNILALLIQHNLTTKKLIDKKNEQVSNPLRVTRGMTQPSNQQTLPSNRERAQSVAGFQTAAAQQSDIAGATAVNPCPLALIRCNSTGILTSESAAANIATRFSFFSHDQQPLKPLKRAISAGPTTPATPGEIGTPAQSNQSSDEITTTISNRL